MPTGLNTLGLVMREFWCIRNIHTKEENAYNFNHRHRLVLTFFFFKKTTLFFRCFSRNWRVMDYGVCELMDLLTEIPDTTITIVHQDKDTIISVPKRGSVDAVLKHASSSF